MRNPDERIRVGIFGVGNVANRQNLPNLTRIDGVWMAAVCKANPQAIEMVTARRIEAAIGEGGVMPMICFRERYRPIVQEAKRLLEDKDISHF